jgi:hypothetical protein
MRMYLIFKTVIMQRGEGWLNLILCLTKDFNIPAKSLISFFLEISNDSKVLSS